LLNSVYIAGVSGCATPEWGNILTEGFDAVGYENTWTTNGTASAINPDYSIASLTDGYTTNYMCSRGLRFVLPDDGVETYITYDRGSAMDLTAGDVDIEFWLYVQTQPANSTSFRAVQIGANSPVNSVVAMVNLERSSAGTLRLFGQGSTVSVAETINEGEWYRVQLHIDSTAAESYMLVNDGTQRTFTRLSNDSPRFLGVGAVAEFDSNENCEIIFDLVSVNYE